ncbi:malonyl-ACP O-methyltransferase BioC [Effusibacillus lacus]|uniref:Malonyl-[acyl-carrier protein] O-methyltransferase n=1 Tax=Effusibacillus lacus TaxID=1348429 RepID=A0A292YJN2_9BACL|nr:malonyl-ACP O-methyltransferase BioC [Effusibacillus lacus]TCS76990.1 malonyl-CoA O-methyltransferase [Effusibacillus lacus]GAX91317.1 malonyl-[acyl-carrier protein] O-methyltransferase BioC [Effusibacillus lacus]
MITAGIDKRLLQKRFSQNAKTYDQYANVQKTMAGKLMDLALRAFPATGFHPPREFRILEIGCGTGFLTSQLLRHFPNASITAVDLAPGMIEIAKQRIAGESVDFRVGDIEEMDLDGTYDLIISNATFQWFNQLPLTVKRLFDVLGQQGVLLFSTFGPRTFEELHASFELAQQRFGLPDQERPGQSFYSSSELKKRVADALDPSDYQIEHSESLEVERFHSVRDFLTSVKKIGASNSNAGPHCQRPGVMKAMIAIYDRQYREEDTIPATYHAIFIKIGKL